MRSRRCSCGAVLVMAGLVPKPEYSRSLSPPAGRGWRAPKVRTGGGPLPYGQNLWKRPLTRSAFAALRRIDLSPQAGRGKKALHQPQLGKRILVMLGALLGEAAEHHLRDAARARGE